MAAAATPSAGMAGGTPECKLPGDVVMELRPNTSLRIGAGLMRNGGSVVATRPGHVQVQPAGDGADARLWMSASSKRYVPRLEDPVLGVVVRRTVDRYAVDIGAAHLAVLDGLAFDGATKRNKPSLALGSLVYCRVVAASKDMDPEVSCCSSVAQQRKDWVTGLGVFGELSGGYCFDVSPALARRLNQEETSVLFALGRHLPFESAVGVNGKVWLRGPHHIATIALVNCIQRAEAMPPEQFQELVDSALPALRA